MKKLVGVLLLALLLCGCKNIAVTDTEVKAVDSVLKIYGGVCNRSKGFKTSNKEKMTYFTLEMSDSKVLEDFKSISELPASNIAYTFYMDLMDERNKYTHINVKLKFQDKQTAEFSFPVTDIEEADKLKSVLLSVAEKIKAKDYSGTYTLFDTADIPELTPAKLEQFCAKKDSAFGQIEYTEFVGFSYFKNEDGLDMVHLGGVAKRTGENTLLNIIVNRRSKKSNGFEI